ncbi:putative two-component system response regulator [Azomonas agilis]|uniref:Putative two-component system response regulator n=1 Tax=Azomonas agilis TaxID=116849 RepID=A0A562IY04_9GAMM|nr:HD domain-containing phosphohydrolase [Azomonas agilis]TWH75941.1 putative two-component system response regulator [Azomonas agilis]
MLPESLRDAQVVVIDDIAPNLRLLESGLRTFGLRQVQAFTDSAAGLVWLQNNPWDLLLLDLNMPPPTGFDILEALKCRDGSCQPIIVITALNDAPNRRKGLQLGANDYLCKPVDLSELLLRVRNTLQLSLASQAVQKERNALEERVQERTQQLTETYQAMLRSLCRAARYRDDETGNHILRIGESAALFAKMLCQSPEWVETIRQAAPMHDIGKIAIPDGILGKPGRLTDEERQVMSNHARIGHEILNDFQGSLLMEMAADIAFHHHEKWDGTGYPQGLKGEEIPLAARIVAICDVYDALRSERPYKKPWTNEEIRHYIHEQSGKHFDPHLVALADQLFDHLEQLQASLSDSNGQVLDV